MISYHLTFSDKKLISLKHKDISQKQISNEKQKYFAIDLEHLKFQLKKCIKNRRDRCASLFLSNLPVWTDENSVYCLQRNFIFEINFE